MSLCKPKHLYQYPSNHSLKSPKTEKFQTCHIIFRLAYSNATARTAPPCTSQMERIKKGKKNISQQVAERCSLQGETTEQERNCIPLETKTILGERVGGLPCFCRGFRCGMSTMPCPTHSDTLGNTGDHANSCSLFAPQPLPSVSAPGILHPRTSAASTSAQELSRSFLGTTGKQCDAHWLTSVLAKTKTHRYNTADITLTIKLRKLPRHLFPCSSFSFWFRGF